MSPQFPRHDGKPGSPTPGVGGQACAVLVDREYGRVIATYLVAEATRRTMPTNDAYVRWEVMFRVLGELGVESIRGKSLEAIRSTAGETGPPRAFDDVDERFPTNRPQWIWEAIATGVRSWSYSEPLPRPRLDSPSPEEVVSPDRPIARPHEPAQAPNEQPEDAEQLVEAIEALKEAAGELRRPPYRQNAEERRAIELRAMDTVKRHYSNLGWEVNDVSAHESFDLICLRDGFELHVEVKGTTIAEPRILLTRNEVRHARKNAQHTALAIVSSIELSRNPLAATGGVLRIWEPWAIDDDGVLVPVGFEYQVTSPPES